MEHGLNAELAVVRAELRRTIEEQEILTAELEASEEELRVANSALQAKAELFEHLAAQLRNLLSSTRIIAIFLDSKLRVRWFTPDADHVVGLLPRDVGRPFADFTLRFTDPDLWRDAKRVLAAQGVMERDVPGQDGRWYARRILPYRSLDERPEGIVITFTEVTARKLAEARVEHLALHDVLTGLPNRTLFDDRLRQALARARRAGTSISLMTLDLDHFKVVNDTLGHPAGDRLLGEVAGRIGQVIRSSDTLARLGGDEFALVQGEVRQPGDVVALARKIVEAVARPFEVDGHQLHTGVSVGIAVWPEDGPTPAALLRSADLALYRAKESGRGRMCFFEPALQLRMEARRTLERELQQGIDRDELVLHFQPQLDLRTGRFAGVESLVRWQHPERGLLGPDEFIPIAETSGLIRPLGRWVLTAACSQARRWLDRGRLLRTAINISPIQARHPDLLQAIDDTLAAYGLDASLIGFEITEGTLLDLSDRVTTNLLEGLRTRGISLSLDDFGVGYSSLAYLRQIAVQQIKIDRSFISGIGQGSDAEALVGAIIGLGHALGKRVVAEGVETSAQLAFLRQLGCDEAQGYLLARPGTAEALAGLLGPAPREVPDH